MIFLPCYNVCTYTQGPWFIYSLIQRTFVESAQIVTPEKSSGRCKVVYHIMVTHPIHNPCGDHTQSGKLLAGFQELLCITGSLHWYVRFEQKRSVVCTTTIVQSVGGESFWTDLELSVYINYYNNISPPATTSPTLASATALT